MATRRRDRIIALFLALLFLVTASALSIAVILQLVQEHRDQNAKKDNGAASTPAETTKDQTNPNQTTLTGTKMQNFTPTTTPVTKLQAIDTKVGTGQAVKAGDTITADYVGALISTGVIFDAAADHGGPQTFSLAGVIKGWQQGVPGMKVGGTRRLLIPANLAYGAQAQNGIPANSDLVFDITVTKIN